MLTLQLSCWVPLHALKYVLTFVSDLILKTSISARACKDKPSYGLLTYSNVFFNGMVFKDFLTIFCPEPKLRFQHFQNALISSPDSPEGVEWGSWVFWKAGDALRTKMAFLPEKNRGGVRSFEEILKNIDTGILFVMF